MMKTGVKITKCKGKGCPIKEDCLRFTAPKRESSDTFTETPYGKDKMQVQTVKFSKYGCTWFVGNSHIKK